jgi:hypothetical protein
MNNYIEITSKIFGIYAAILAIIHGIFEFNQGDIITNRVNIHAIGPSCAADQIWHACFPAMTLWPTFRLAGIFTILFSTGLLVMVLFFFHTKQAKWLIFLFAICILLSGGGFIPVFTCLMAGISNLFNPRQSTKIEIRSWIAALWGFLAIMYMLYAAGGWLFGKFFNAFMVQQSGVLFVLMDLVLPITLLFLATQLDRQRLFNTADS